MTKYYVFDVDGYTKTMAVPAEIVEYVCYTVATDKYKNEIALHLWEKALGEVHVSHFPRAGLRQLLRFWTGREHYHKILHHWHSHKNYTDAENIYEGASRMAYAKKHGLCEVMYK